MVVPSEEVHGRTAAPPVRLADTDAWLESLRRNSYWKRESGGGSSGSERPRRSRESSTTTRSSRNVNGESSGRTSSHRTTSTSFAISKPGYESFSRRHGSGETYRTVCVRLCDGFYWPVSFATNRSNLHRDSEACQSSCQSPAALFYHPNPGGELEEMVDLEGKPYSELGTAFAYRTTYNASCKCRPHPWEPASLERHEGYAERERGDTPDAPAKDTPPHEAEKVQGTGTPPAR